MKRVKIQNLTYELASRTHDAEGAARVARGCREEQDDDEIDDQEDAGDEESVKSLDHFLVLFIGQDAGQDSKPAPAPAKNRADQEGKEAVEEQPE